MANAVKWAAASTARTLIDLGTTLANNTFSALGSEIDNSTNLDTAGWLELTTSSGNLFGGAVSADDAYVDVYMVQAPDGTNYENTPDVDGEFPDSKVYSLKIPTETEVKPLVSKYAIPLPPHKIKFLVYNNGTSQTMQNVWELNMYTNNLEIQ